MPFPKSLYQPLRQGQLSAANGYRAFFAPFNKVASLSSSFANIGPTILDLQTAGPFRDASLPAHWNDLGLVLDVKPSNASKMGSIRTGHRNMVRALYPGDLAETVSVKFKERSRMVDQISTGMQVFNLLSNPGFVGTAAGPLSASGATAIAMGASGFMALGLTGTVTAGQPTLFVPTGSGASFLAGQYIVCDQDYIPGTSGYVGDSAALVFPGNVSDVDFIRKTSDYVARIVSIVPGVAGQDALILNKSFVGGGNNLIIGNTTYGPTAGAKVQIVKGYSQRNGGSKINEWSALFLMDTEDSSQFALYYPRLACTAPKGLTSDSITDATGAQYWGMEAEFTAMGFDDPIDGEPVLSYQAYYPNAGQDIQI